MTVTAVETTARAALKQILSTEFAPEGFPIKDDRLHGSLGSNGTILGTSPVQSVPRTGNEQVLNVEILVQFYGKWNKVIDPTQTVDPSKIENYAERFRRALRTGDPNTDNVWYFQLTRMNFPTDPTGNITRFEATVRAVSQNSALVESIG